MQRFNSQHAAGRSLRRNSAYRPLWLSGLLAIGFAAAACSELEPIVEPEVGDLQLTLATLRTQVRDAQRSLAEARVELESRRQELADAQVARAQLEGRVREAERRGGGERVFRSSSQLQNQMRQMQRKAAKAGSPPIAEPADALVPTGTSYQWSF